MSRNTFVIVLLLLFNGAAWQLNAQTLVIRQSDGTLNTDLLSSIQKLSFADANLKVRFKSGTTDNYSLSLIQRVYFDNLTSVGEAIAVDDQRLKLYPNPVGAELHLENIPVGTTILNVYRMDGKMVMQSGVSGNSATLQTGNLPGGMYIIRADDENVKFIKL